MTMDDPDVFLCGLEPPHRLRIVSMFRTPGGVAFRVRDADDPFSEERELFVTNRELKGGYENVWKACFVCVNQGRKERAVAFPKKVFDSAAGASA
jgi:hypothetical protein